MNALQNIPKKYIIRDLLLASLWSFMNAQFSNSLAIKFAELIDGGPIIDAIIYFAVFITLWELVEFICDVLSEVTSAVIECNVNKAYFNRLYRVKPSVLKAYNTGYISGLLNKLVVRQENAYSHLIMHIPISTIYSAYFAVVMWQKHWILSVLLVMIVIVGNVLRLCVGSIAEKYAAELSAVEGIRNKSVVDFVSNINTVQKMRSVSFMNDVLDVDNEECIKKTKKWVIFDEIAFCGCKFVVFSYTPIALIACSLLLKELVNPSEFYISLAAISIQLVHNAKDFAKSISVYNKFNGTRNKMEEILKPENLRQDILEEEFQSLSIEDLSFSYELKRSNDAKIVEVNIPKFSFKKGDKVCIYGESGQGKTTLLHLLSGEIENDKTLINGKKSDKRLKCMFIAQDTEMFDMSLRNNISLGRCLDTFDFLRYMKAVGLDEWYDSQKDGWNTILGERGVFVSTGQRQRLNLIRGLIAHNDEEVFLLDEPTSNVDEEIEQKMIELIKEVLYDKTVVIVTHRPKIKEICDKFYKFENSTLSEVSREDALSK